MKKWVNPYKDREEIAILQLQAAIDVIEARLSADVATEADEPHLDQHWEAGYVDGVTMVVDGDGWEVDLSQWVKEIAALPDVYREAKAVVEYSSYDWTSLKNALARAGVNAERRSRK